ncbi:putative high affinity immunoglobulin gamma Fc receptor IC, partial [Haplochromis burtoni]|uniref:putative high affinity immunoglobulin gamma Fc receptor IC n=1 Tax=Haplochromis burtoni TaxID=8153 RepID=UPI001C2D8529
MEFFYQMTKSESHREDSTGAEEKEKLTTGTQRSESVWIDTTVSNRPVVTLHPNWSEIYRGETITVRCEIHGGDTEWDYEWEANSIRKPPNLNEYRIIYASSSNSGNYRCKGRMKSSQHETTEWSDSVTLTVSTSKPRATLTAQSSIIPAGGSVTLSCSVEGSAGWKFDWFRRDSVSSKAQLMRGNEANRVISVSQGGLYHCRGGRGDPVYYTEDSSDVTVTETCEFNYFISAKLRQIKLCDLCCSSVCFLTWRGGNEKIEELQCHCDKVCTLKEPIWFSEKKIIT